MINSIRNFRRPPLGTVSSMCSWTDLIRIIIFLLLKTTWTWSVIHANQMWKFVTLGKFQYKTTSPAVGCSFNIAEFTLPHHRWSNSWKKNGGKLRPKAPFWIRYRIPSNNIAMWIETKQNEIKKEIEIDEKIRHKTSCLHCQTWMLLLPLSTMKEYDKTLYFW